LERLQAVSRRDPRCSSGVKMVPSRSWPAAWFYHNDSNGESQPAP
jgi:hypothetical protein